MQIHSEVKNTHQELLEVLPKAPQQMATLEASRAFFLNEESLRLLAERIITMSNGGEALTIHGVVTGSYATEVGGRARPGENDGSRLHIAGTYGNVWKKEPNTASEWAKALAKFSKPKQKHTLERELQRPNMIAGFATVEGRRMGFSIPVTETYAPDTSRALSASYAYSLRGISYQSMWGAEEVGNSKESTFVNHPEALYLALSQIALMSGVGFDWIVPRAKSELIKLQAEEQQSIPRETILRRALGNLSLQQRQVA